MGVHGLWKLIEPSGQMVPLESLAGKVLAVDISIWLHQAVKGMHDAQGAPMAVAHLLILFHRLCKLLFYKIKPVFVFDGGVPLLKTQTMATRRQRSNVAKTEALKVREKLIKNLLKHEAVRQVLSNETASAVLGLGSFTLPGPSVEEDLYKLPPIATDCVDSDCSEEEISTDDEKNEKHLQDIHSIDVTSKEFLSLPAEVRHEILTELIETRKQSSWKHLDSMPKQSDSFSDFQMDRLLKRHAVQTSLEKAGKEMGGRALSLKELEELLGDQRVIDPKIDLPSKRIAQDSVTRYMLIQKDAEQVSEKFDVMEHLEDVEWSSESDTDVILDKRKKEVTASKNIDDKHKILISEPDVQTAKEMADILSVLEGTDAKDVTVKTEYEQNALDFNSTFGESSNMTGGIENVIKTVHCRENFNLSDCTQSYKNHTEDCITVVSIDNEKKNSADKIDVEIESANEELSEYNKTVEDNTLDAEPVTKEISKESENKFKEVRDSCVNFESLKPVEETIVETESVNEIQVESKVEEVGDSRVDLDRKGIAKSKETSTEIEISSDLKEKETVENSSETNNMEAAKEPESKSEEVTDSYSNSEVKRSGNKIEDFDTFREKKTKSKLKDISDSSSDSESDFIPITPSEMESMQPQTTTKETASNFPTAQSDSVTIVINPSEVSQKDDFFADVFETAEAHKDEQQNKKEFEENILAEDLSKALEQEHSQLMQEKGKQERHALNLTDQIYTDAQELLRLFGIPFVVAPMEAEAQCATLNALGLTEGTITDDSDIWLFGGRVVYKNFFNQNKHVLEYRSENIEKNFKLTREEMIKIALLVGSDYTVGLNGIGPVTALEIIAAFQSPNIGALESLLKFREWFMGTAKGIPPRTTLRKKIKNTVMTPGFPSKAVFEAYLHPLVDDSKEPFSWAKPNVDLIHKYARAKMGWSKEKCNDLLQPIMKKLEEKNSQTTIEKHFKFAQKPGVTEGILSKRVENAIKRLGNSSMESDELECESKSDSKVKRKRKQTNQSRAEKSLTGEGYKSVKKPKMVELNCSAKEEAKLKLIKDRLHRNVKVPQKEMAQKALENKKKEAIRIFRTYGKHGKKKTKVFAKEEANLSESSSDD